MWHNLVGAFSAVGLRESILTPSGIPDKASIDTISKLLQWGGYTNVRVKASNIYYNQTAIFPCHELFFPDINQILREKVNTAIQP